MRLPAFPVALLPFGAIDTVLGFVIINVMKSIGRSGVLKFLVVCGLFTALPIAASAARIIVCSTCDPVPVLLTQESQLNDVQPSDTDANGDQTVEYLNLTGSLINDLVFTTTINSGLSVSMLSADGDFTCVAPDGYFLNCLVSYNPGDGLLTYDYFGVNPPNYQDLPGFVIYEDLVGGGFGNTGIPELGLFSIELTGWTSGLTDTTNPNNPVQLYGGEPTLTNAFNAPDSIPPGSIALPEPSAALILLTELLLLAGALALFGRRLNWKKRFDL